MSQLQNCSVMCTKNGSYCENEKKREKARWEVGMCTKNGSYCEKKKRSEGRCERRSEAFVKIIFFFFFFFGGGGGVGLGGSGWM